MTPLNTYLAARGEGAKLMETCLFCEHPEKGYTPPKGVEFVCSKCVNRFCDMERKWLKTSILWLEESKERLCLLGDYTVVDNKIKALKMFLEDINEQRRPKTKKFGTGIDRKGNNAVPWNHKKPTRLVTRKGDAFHKGES